MSSLLEIFVQREDWFYCNLSRADLWALRATCWDWYLTVPLLKLYPPSIEHRMKKSNRRLDWFYAEYDAYFNTKDGRLHGVQHKAGKWSFWLNGRVIRDVESKFDQLGRRHGSGQVKWRSHTDKIWEWRQITYFHGHMARIDQHLESHEHRPNEHHSVIRRHDRKRHNKTARREINELIS